MKNNLQKDLTANGWSQSERFRAIGRAAITEWNRTKRPLLPRCTAVAKHSAQRCKQLACENGKCRFHGGRTPSGKGWHKPVWPNGKAPDAEKKLNDKLKSLRRAQRQRDKRIAAMTPDERARYNTWLKTHRPTSAGDRARARRAREDAKLLLTYIDAPPASLSDEAAMLQAKIDALEAELGRRAVHHDQPDIFG